MEIGNNNGLQVYKRRCASQVAFRSVQFLMEQISNVAMAINPMTLLKLGVLKIQRQPILKTNVILGETPAGVGSSSPLLLTGQLKSRFSNQGC